MPFPRDRFARAGATPEQVDVLQTEYDALTPDAQAGYDARIAPLSDYGVAELLKEPVAEVEADEPEVEAEDKKPASSSGSASSSSSAASSASSGSSTEK